MTPYSKIMPIRICTLATDTKPRFTAKIGSTADFTLLSGHRCSDSQCWHSPTGRRTVHFAELGDGLGRGTTRFSEAPRSLSAAPASQFHVKRHHMTGRQRGDVRASTQWTAVLNYCDAQTESPDQGSVLQLLRARRCISPVHGLYAAGRLKSAVSRGTN